MYIFFPGEISYFSWWCKLPFWSRTLTKHHRHQQQQPPLQSDPVHYQDKRNYKTYKSKETTHEEPLYTHSNTKNPKMQHNSTWVTFLLLQVCVKLSISACFLLHFLPQISSPSTPSDWIQGHENAACLDGFLPGEAKITKTNSKILIFFKCSNNLTVNCKPELHSVTSTLVTIFLDVYVFANLLCSTITILFNMTPSPPRCAKRPMHVASEGPLFTGLVSVSVASARRSRLLPRSWAAPAPWGKVAMKYL